RFSSSGGSAVYESSQLQRRMRDLHAAAQHASIHQRHYVNAQGASEPPARVVARLRWGRTSLRRAIRALEKDHHGRSDWQNPASFELATARSGRSGDREGGGCASSSSSRGPTSSPST